MPQSTLLPFFTRVCAGAQSLLLYSPTKVDGGAPRRVGGRGAARTGREGALAPGGGGSVAGYVPSPFKAGESGRMLLNFRSFSARNLLCSSCTCVVGKFAASESFSYIFLYFGIFLTFTVMLREAVYYLLCDLLREPRGSR